MFRLTGGRRGKPVGKKTDIFIMTCTVMPLLDQQHRCVDYTLVRLYAGAAWFYMNKQWWSIGELPLWR